MEMGADHQGFHHEVTEHYKGFDSILVIMDSFTKSARFLAIRDSYSTENLVEICVR